MSQRFGRKARGSLIFRARARVYGFGPSMGLTGRPAHFETFPKLDVFSADGSGEKAGEVLLSGLGPGRPGLGLTWARSEGQRSPRSFQIWMFLQQMARACSRGQPHLPVWFSGSGLTWAPFGWMCPETEGPISSGRKASCLVGCFPRTKGQQSVLTRSAPGVVGGFTVDI